MSYARLSNPGSDIYLWGTGNALCLQVRHSVSKKLSLGRGWKTTPFKNPHAGFYAEYTSREELLGDLAELRRDGVRVPQDAIDRLLEEINEDGDEY